MDLNKICQEVIITARDTGDFILNERKNQEALNIEIKGKNDFVTNIDKLSEQRIIDRLSKLLPEAGFIAEENTLTIKGNIYNWIIDPIDGTTNFIHGLFPFAISIALQKNNETILGVVHEIGLNETFSAYEGSSAQLNGTTISVTQTKNIKDSLIATGFPYSNYSKINQYIKTLEYFMKNSHGIRRLGSAATDLAYVACGRFDAFYEYNLKPWDVAAGAFIIQKAGGKVCDFSGGENYIYGHEIIASNNNTFHEFSNTIKSIMK